MHDLPIFEVKKDLETSLKNKPITVLKAPPGAGKTTQVPYWASQIFNKRIILLQPRRIAAIGAASQLKQHFSDDHQVGYQVRFDNQLHEQNKIQVMTTGLFLKRLQNDPELLGIDLVIFDEFHERTADMDIALSLCRASQQYYCEHLRLLIMSATLFGNQLARQLQAPQIESKGKSFPLDIEYINHSTPPTHEQIAQYVLSICQRRDGHVLVFLPGKKEIFSVNEYLNQNGLVLHGGLTLNEQKQVLMPSDQQKIILATNIAESSLTIEGVDTVIDSGLERQNKLLKNNVQALTLSHISQASADQRAGRAARQAPGLCLRLWQKEKQLAPQPISEIKRTDLSPQLLNIASYGIEVKELSFIDQLPVAQYKSNTKFLEQIGAIDQGRLTPLGSKISNSSLGITASVILFEPSNPKNIQALLALFIDQQCPGNESDFFKRLEQFRITLKTGRVSKTCAALWQRLKQTVPEPINQRQQQAMINSLIKAMPQWICFNQEKLLSTEGVLLTSFQKLKNNQWYLVVDHFASTNQQAIVHINANLIIPIEPPEYLYEQRFDMKVVNKQPQWFKVTHLGKIQISSHRSSPNADQLQAALLDLIKQQTLKKCIDDSATVNWLNRVKIIEQQAQLPSFTWSSLEENLDWLTPYLTDVKTLTQIPWLQALKSRLTFAQQKNVDSLAPDFFISPSGNKHRLHYKDGSITLSVRLQELFGLNSMLTVGSQPITIELLSPAHRPIQITQDLPYFWQNSYLEVKKEMKGRYPKHNWPDDPINAKASSKTKKAQGL